MRKSRFNQEQIIGILREQEAGIAVTELCRKPGVSSPTFYKWKAKYGGMGAHPRQARRPIDTADVLRVLKRQPTSLSTKLAPPVLIALEAVATQCVIEKP